MSEMDLLHEAARRVRARLPVDVFENMPLDQLVAEVRKELERLVAERTPDRSKEHDP